MEELLYLVGILGNLTVMAAVVIMKMIDLVTHNHNHKQRTQP